MDVVLAVDLKGGYVVHGCSGNRETYAPLTWGLSPSAEPSAYLAVMQPKYLYVADLDRIAMCGDHTEQILRLAERVTELWVDRGCSIPEEYLREKNIHNIVGTETIDAPLDEFDGGFLSIDIKDGCVIGNAFGPGTLPAEALHAADETNLYSLEYLIGRYHNRYRSLIRRTATEQYRKETLLWRGSKISG